MQTTATCPIRTFLLVTFTLLASIPQSVAVADGHVKTHPASIEAAPPPSTSELLLTLVAGTDVSTLASDYGLSVKCQLQSDPNTYVLAADSAGRAQVLATEGLLHDCRVSSVYLNEVSHNVAYGFVPNDPLFGPTGGFGGEWPLVNQVGTGIDADVQGAWQRGVTGQGVTIGIVDDGLQWTHPDLQPNYIATSSYNFGSYVGNGSANDPTPVNSDDQHGTSVAGVAAARGGNAIGVTGAAPYASLAGLRVDFDYQTTAQFVDATLYHSSGSDTSIQVKNHSYGISTPFVKDSGTVAEREALHTSTLAGTIHCFAAGNDRGTDGADANKKYLQSSPDAITVAAVASNGTYAYYSNYGANVFVAAPSSGGAYRVTTTDLVGAGGYNSGSGGSDYSNADYTSTFGGTSAATPLVTGVLALAKQVQPDLDTRFAKHLLALTSQRIDPNDSSVSGGGDGIRAGSAWVVNAAGYAFNENYGFGLIDGDRLTQEATHYSGVTPLQTAGTGTMTVGLTIPDNDPAGVLCAAAVTATTPLEEILVTLNITHSYRGDLEGWLTSPSGTISRLFESNDDDYSNISWQFLSNAFWGEDPFGTWTLKIDDTAEYDIGIWNSWALDLRMGELVPVPEPGAAISLAMAVASLWCGSWRCRRRAARGDRS